MAVAIGSDAHDALITIVDERECLRIEGHEGQWFIRSRPMPGTMNDGLARVTLAFAG